MYGDVGLPKVSAGVERDDDDRPHHQMKQGHPNQVSSGEYQVDISLTIKMHCFLVCLQKQRWLIVLAGHF